MRIKWPRGKDRYSGWEYFLMRPFGLWLEVSRVRGRRTVFACQHGQTLPTSFHISCSHNHFNWRRIRVYFRHVNFQIGIGRSRPHNQVGGTGYWSWPGRLPVHHAWFCLDRALLGDVDDCSRRFIRSAMRILEGCGADR